MKKILLPFLLLLTLLVVPSITSASNNDLSARTYSSNFAVIDGGTYYLNDYNMLGPTKGIYKMSSNLKSSRLIVAGDFSNLKQYKNSFIVYDYEKEHVVQLSLKGKVIKDLKHITTSNFQVYHNHIYYFDHASNSFYQSQIVGNKVQYLRNTGASYVNEFIVHNGWIYYAHEFSYGEYGEYSEAHLSKFYITKPAKATKLINKVYNIDSLIAKNGYIYAVVHKSLDNLDRNLYRVNLNGKNLTRVSKQNMSNHAINSKYVYFIENSFNDRVKLYRMTINGKNVKAIATLPGRQHSLDAIGKSLYLTIRDGSKYTFQRRVLQ